jgi:hypothetical protein
VINNISWLRQWIAVALAVLLVPFTQSSLYAQGAYAPLDATQLDQLVAPIALYPDSLVAQVLTAATFTDQVNEANNWIHQNGGMPPAQLAAAINSMPWDPSVKAVAEFPAVLDNMARNNGWSSALGNAYYNQPGDVMNAVQAMRYQAQQAGTLRTTPQERVFYSSGLVVIEPVNPALVYVPYYNPWTVWGSPISPWGGYYWGPPAGVVFGAGIAIGFGVGIGIGLFGHYGWGYHAWAPNWHGGVVVYNHNTYISRSTTVYNRGHFGGYNRGVFEHEGRGVPGGYHPAVTAHTAAYGHPGPGGGAYHPAAGGAYHPGAAGNHQAVGAGAYHPGVAEGNHPGGAGAYHGGAPAYHPASGGVSHGGTAPGHQPASGGYHPAAGGSHASAGGSRPAAQTYHAPSQPAHQASPSGGGARPQVHEAPKGGEHRK